MTKKIVLFDIDYTLFNTVLFRKNFYHALSLIVQKPIREIRENERKASYQVNKKFGYLNFKSYIETLTHELKEKEKTDQIIKACMDEITFDKSIYREAKKIIQDLSKVATVGIFSKGDTSFQISKIKAIKHFFQDNNIHIISDKHKALAEILNKYKSYKIYLVDDALDILHLAKKQDQNIMVIWVKRGRFAKTQEPIEGFVPDATIVTLKKMVQLVK